MDVENQMQDFYGDHSLDDLHEEVNVLKNRLSKTDKELQLLTEALKTTLVDVKALMNDIDNPFNLIKNMGIDNLVDKAVEKVTDNVKKVRREKDTDSAFNNKHFKEPERYLVSPDHKGLGDQSSQEEQGLPRLERKIAELEGRVEKMITDPQTLAGQKKIDVSASVPADSKLKVSVNKFYDFYISLLTDYLFHKHGEKRSEEILFSCLNQEGTSGRIVGDLISSLKEQGKNAKSSGKEKLSFHHPLKSFLHDKIFLSSILKDLDSPGSVWSEQSQLLVLMSLVNEVKNNQVEGCGCE